MAESTVGTVTQVASSVVSVTLLAANSSRKAFSIYNDSTATLYVKCSATGAASTVSFSFPLGPKSGTVLGGYFEAPLNYQGLVQGIWDSAVGNAYVTEYTP